MMDPGDRAQSIHLGMVARVDDPSAGDKQGAVGTSLVAVTAFGLTTAFNYALSGLVDWLLAALFIGGGVIGSLAGTKAAKRLSGGGHLTSVFAVLIFVVAAYMLWQSAGQAF